MPSLQRRLLLGTAIGTACVFLASGIGLYLTMRASLLSEFDNALDHKLRTMASLIEQEGNHIDLEFTEADMAEFDRADRPEYYQVWRSDGSVLRRSPSLNGMDLNRVEGVRETVLPDGRPGRLAGMTFHVRAGEHRDAPVPPVQLTLVLARDTQHVDAALSSLRLVLLAVGGAATLLLMGVLAWIVRFGLRPVGRLASEIERIDENRLSARIDPAQAPRELSIVVHRLNEMLARLATAFEREKTLTADVAHELRTPLAGLRSTLEVSLSRERNTDAYREALEDCLSICVQTEAMVSTLLELTRLDMHRDDLDYRPVEVSRLIRDAWKPFEERAKQQRLNVSWEVERGLTFNTDGRKLQLVLSNIFENAVNYTNARGNVRVQSDVNDGELRVCVSNSGSPVSGEEAGRVFDRFWRGDAARRDTGVHCGLGLSLCKEFVERLNGSIRAEASPEGDFSITVRLPSNGPPPVER